jgi:hypothetical protein
MDTLEISASANPGAENEAPLELLFAQQNLLKLGMYALYSPESADYLRECIAYELERAEKILLARMGCADVERHRNAIIAARNALDRSKH